jgi:enediyne polyketide synthase
MAEAAGLRWTRLPVSHAFHSPLVAPAAGVFGEWLAGQDLAPITRRVVSTVTGEPLTPRTDLRALLRRQITEPVRFLQAVEEAAREVDLFVEVGPGRVLTGLCREIARTTPRLSCDDLMTRPAPAGPTPAGARV